MSSPPQSSAPSEFSVGQVVRVEVPMTDGGNNKKHHQRTGMIATCAADEATVLACWNHHHSDDIPMPGVFAPLVLHQQGSDPSEEWTVPWSRVHPLQDFEINRNPSSNENDKNNLQLKTHGDALLQLGDGAAAVPYYERALWSNQKLSKKDSDNGQPSSFRYQTAVPPSIGSTALVQVFGNVNNDRNNNHWQLWLVEVDCVEQDDDGDDGTIYYSVDVTILLRCDPFQHQTSSKVSEQTLKVQESTISDQDNQKNKNATRTTRVVLTVDESSDDNDDVESFGWQERTLLNLTRCFLSLSQEQQQQQSSPSAWTEAALLTTTCVLALLQHKSSENDNDVAESKQQQQWQHTAFLLRAKAWLRRGQYDLATANVQDILTAAKNPASSLRRQAEQLQRDIDQKKALAAQQTRRLVKDMCQWIDGATNSNKDNNSSSKKNANRNKRTKQEQRQQQNSVSGEEHGSAVSSKMAQTSSSSSKDSPPWNLLLALLILLLAYWVQAGGGA